ncbi:MAG: hypothetical protein ACR9NN_08475 [Nostochopsis sp.]
MLAQPISFEQEIELSSTSKRSARKAKLAVRFCPVNLRTPYRFDDRDPILVYAVYGNNSQLRIVPSARLDSSHHIYRVYIYS